MLKKSVKRIIAYAKEPWYPYLISFFTLLDIFIGIIPSDPFLISAVLAQKKKWLQIALIVVVGNILGAGLLAAVVYWDAPWLQQTFPQFFSGYLWNQVEIFMGRYGGFAIVPAIVGVLPVQPFIIASILAGYPPLKLMLIYSLGRVAKLTLIGWICSHAPHLINRWFVTTEDAAPIVKELKKK